MREMHGIGKNPMFSETFMEKPLLKIKKLMNKKYILYDNDEIFKYISVENIKKNIHPILL